VLERGNASSCYPTVVGLALVGLLFVSDAMLAEPPICLTKYEYVRVGLWWQLFWR
jgi:hypothetical protein